MTTGISGKVWENFTFIEVPNAPVPLLTGPALVIYIMFGVLIFAVFCVVWYYVWFGPGRKKHGMPKK